MERLNFFTPYQHKKPHFEDQLTRAFLVVLRYTPLARAAFLDIVRELSANAGNKKLVPSFSLLEQSDLSIKTQKNTIDEQDAVLLSIAITDENWKVESDVQSSDRGARYDGLIYYSDNWIFVIENKPFFQRTGAWEEQLRPNLPANTSIEIEPKPIVVQWRDIIRRFNHLLDSGTLNPAERILLEDFLFYIDNNFSALNPFDQLDLCKNDLPLLRRRCRAILDELFSGQVDDSWASYGELHGTASRMFLFPEEEGTTWKLKLAIFPGNNKPQCQEFFKSVNERAFNNLESQGWELAPFLTFSSYGQNISHSVPDISAQAYLDYWKKNPNTIGQYKRNGVPNYNKLRETLVGEQQLTPECLSDLSNSFESTDRKVINIAPGFKLVRSWDSIEASEQDRTGQLRDSIKQAAIAALSTWNQPFPTSELSNES